MVTLAGSVKKSLVLAAMVALVCAPVRGFAAEDSSSTTERETQVMSGTRVITNYYNAFGSLMSSTEVSDQVVKTTSTVKQTDKDDVTTESYTLQHTEVTSEWIGGGLKTTRVEGFYATGGDPANGIPGPDENGDIRNTSPDGSWSRTDFVNIYQYDDNGRLTGVTGGIPTTDENGKAIMVNSLTTGNQGTDPETNDPNGTYRAYSIDTYEIRNGQALKTSTTSIQITDGIGENGAGASRTESTTTFEYELLGGSWVMSSMYETTDSKTTKGPQTGSTSHQEKETIYHRNADGTLIDDKDANGSYKAIEVIMHAYTNVVKQDGGTSTWNLQTYEYTVSLDPQQGYYISSETITQKIDTANSGASGNNAGTVNATGGESSVESSAGSSASSGSASEDHTTTKIQHVLDLDSEEAITAAIAAAKEKAAQDKLDIEAAIAAAKATYAQHKLDIEAAIAAVSKVHNIAW